MLRLLIQMSQRKKFFLLVSFLFFFFLSYFRVFAPPTVNCAFPTWCFHPLLAWSSNPHSEESRKVKKGSRGADQLVGRSVIDDGV